MRMRKIGVDHNIGPLLFDCEHTRPVAIETVQNTISCENALSLLFVANGLCSAILQASTFQQNAGWHLAAVIILIQQVVLIPQVILFQRTCCLTRHGGAFSHSDFPSVIK